MLVTVSCRYLPTALHQELLPPTSQDSQNATSSVKLSASNDVSSSSEFSVSKLTAAVLSTFSTLEYTRSCTSITKTSQLSPIVIPSIPSWSSLSAVDNGAKVWRPDFHITGVPPQETMTVAWESWPPGPELESVKISNGPSSLEMKIPHDWVFFRYFISCMPTSTTPLGFLKVFWHILLRLNIKSSLVRVKSHIASPVIFWADRTSSMVGLVSWSSSSLWDWSLLIGKLQPFSSSIPLLFKTSFK